MTEGRWKGWQLEVLDCIRSHVAEQRNSEFSLDDIHGKYGEALEKRAPSRDHIDRTVRSTIRGACRGLCRKGIVERVEPSRYRLLGLLPPAPIDRFDLPPGAESAIVEGIELLTEHQEKLKALPEGPARDAKTASAARMFLILVLSRAVYSLQRRVDLLEREPENGTSRHEEQEVEPGQATSPTATWADAGSLLVRLLDVLKLGGN